MYLEDTDLGGETEFMRLKLLVRPRKGTAIVWANCEVQDVPAVDTRSEGAWDERRGACRAGRVTGAPAIFLGQQAGEHVQRPCCVGRDARSLHQGRPVGPGGAKWTLSIFMHQVRRTRTMAPARGRRSLPRGGRSAAQLTYTHDTRAPLQRYVQQGIDNHETYQKYRAGRLHPELANSTLLGPRR